MPLQQQLEIIKRFFEENMGAWGVEDPTCATEADPNALRSDVPIKEGHNLAQY